MNKELRVAVVGFGRVGKTIACLIKQTPYQLETVILHKEDQEIEIKQLWQINYVTSIERADWDFPLPDLLFITTPDNVIETTASKLATYKRDEWKKVIVFHCSGAFSSKLLLPLSNLGASVGSMHPLKSFAQPINSTSELAAVYWCIEGNLQATEIANFLVKTTLGKAVTIEASKKHFITQQQ